jgi:hypothetical protein
MMNRKQIFLGLFPISLGIVFMFAVLYIANTGNNSLNSSIVEEPSMNLPVFSPVDPMKLPASDQKKLFGTTASVAPTSASRTSSPAPAPVPVPAPTSVSTPIRVSTVAAPVVEYLTVSSSMAGAQVFGSYNSWARGVFVGPDGTTKAKLVKGMGYILCMGDPEKGGVWFYPNGDRVKAYYAFAEYLGGGRWLNSWDSSKEQPAGIGSPYEVVMTKEILSLPPASVAVPTSIPASTPNIAPAPVSTPAPAPAPTLAPASVPVSEPDSVLISEPAEDLFGFFASKKTTPTPAPASVPAPAPDMVPVPRTIESISTPLIASVEAPQDLFSALARKKK